VATVVSVRVFTSKFTWGERIFAIPSARSRRIDFLRVLLTRRYLIPYVRSPMVDQLRHYKAKLEYEIDPWDLNEALGRGDKILLVDTRSPEAYRRSHIPGAINIPHRTMYGHDGPS
jgi:Rhodanese-like domain